MDAESLRARAAEYRQMAEEAQDPWVRDSLQFLALVYEEEAVQRERRKKE